MSANNSMLPGALAKEEKIFTLICGSVSAGKTTVSTNLAALLASTPHHNGGVFAMDKDTLGGYAEKCFELHNEEVYDRTCDFFTEHCRDLEYIISEDLCLRGLMFCRHAQLNAPFTAELREEFAGRSSEHLKKLHDAVRARGGVLVVVFLSLDYETAYARLMKRKILDPECVFRTPKVYNDIPKFLSGQNLSGGENIINADFYFNYDARTPRLSFAKLCRFYGVDCDGSVYDENICKKEFYTATKPYIYTAEGSRRPTAE